MKDIFKFAANMESMTDEEMNEQQEFVKNYQMPALRPLRYVYEGESEVVTYKTNELIGVCPATGLPDIYDLDIVYVPNEHIIELKSLKFYLVEFKDIPIFHEHLAVRILADFVNAAKPKSAEVHLDVAIRGGISTLVIKKWSE